MVVRYSDINEAVKRTEYAVRGPIVARARELELQGREIIYCNIGNPQALRQQPLTWFRQVLALCEWPELARLSPGAFPEDVLETAKKILDGSQHGIGAYSESKGIRTIRAAVADFITRRDGIASDPESIFLTDGASKGVQSVLRILIANDDDGIMIPIPQYPLYSATITLYGAKQVSYYLDEEHDWKLDERMLEDSIAKAKANKVNVRAICVINPGNPTGSVLDAANIEMVLRFAKRHNLAVLADEVYQDNIYRPGDSFVSFAKVLEQMKEKDVSLFSFHSTSKGFLGECGHRGGYLEVRNLPADVMAELLKLQSVSLCSNIPGQVATYLMVTPPQEGSPSYEGYQKEKKAILDALRRKAQILADGLNKVEGIRCNTVAGAMYAFPQITIPAGRTDEDYCMALLEKTGICVVPGTGFGQRTGTAHFRTTILPPTEKIQEVVNKIAEFHRSYR